MCLQKICQHLPDDKVMGKPLCKDAMVFDEDFISKFSEVFNMFVPARYCSCNSYLSTAMGIEAVIF